MDYVPQNSNFVYVYHHSGRDTRINKQGVIELATNVAAAFCCCTEIIFIVVKFLTYVIVTVQNPYILRL